MLNIRLACDKDINKVIEFYKLVSDDKNNKARWHYGLYPTDEDLIEDINNNELYNKQNKRRQRRTYCFRPS